MARPREFDLDNTLERAMQAFWAKGYEATSLDDLCSATKLGRSSLYAAFGDKRNLYLHVLDRYESAAVGRILSAVAQSKSPLKGIRIFVDHIIENIVAGPGRRGCGCWSGCSRPSHCVHQWPAIPGGPSCWRPAGRWPGGF